MTINGKEVLERELSSYEKGKVANLCTQNASLAAPALAGVLRRWFGIELNGIINAQDGNCGLGGKTEALDFGDGWFEDTSL